MVIVVKSGEYLVVVVNFVKMAGLVIGIKNMTLTNLVVAVNVLALFFYGVLSDSSQ